MRIGAAAFLLGLLPALAAGADCLPDARTMCLLDDRFAATVAWTNPYPPGGAGHGQAVALTNEAGYFWFFREGNIELTIKLLDGRPVTGTFWFFAASMSTLGMNLDVVDTRSGWFRRFRNPELRQSTINDHLPDGPPLGHRILFLGAHPDDEVLAAPLLGHLCRSGVRVCQLVVLTAGENGSCELPGGCLPDLATVRRQEVARSASYLGASLVQRSLPDAPGPSPAQVRAAWAQASGGDGPLLESIMDAILDWGPSSILVFDPRHGSTCHPAHRALGTLALEAAATTGRLDSLYWIETFARGVSQPPIVLGPAVADEGRLAGFDASGPLEGAPTPPWEHLLAVVALHASQFTAAQQASLASQPPEGRRVFLLPATAGLQDSRYELCGD